MTDTPHTESCASGLLHPRSVRDNRAVRTMGANLEVVSGGFNRPGIRVRLNKNHSMSDDAKVDGNRKI